ncbi:MAG: thiamine pyrophosphate-binding protein [Lachnospiraceae bacterium]|nr:thiamine pyrophosphate-binding protein [Lachnospiraceae bacterium]
MQQKLSEYIADFLVEHEVKDGFTVTGGGAMHLNDAFGHKEGLHMIYNHHEQACSIAAEGYARLTGRIALVCVTSGPGGTNAITGVLGGWQDSIPMFVISGQVKRITTTASTDVPLRQLGDQEFQITDTVKNMTKYAVMVNDPEKIRYHLEKAWYLANTGRKGPVWLDIPLDVQAAKIEPDKLEGFNPAEFDELSDVSYDELQRRDDLVSKYNVPKSELNHISTVEYDENISADILEKIAKAKKPVILAGTGVRLAGAFDEFREFIDLLNIPVLTAWNAHDLIEADHPLFAGKPGTVGTRGGNFVAQNCDLLLVLGCRMNIRIISYNDHQFAKNAYKIVVDIDENELHKPTVDVDMPVHANLKDVLISLNKILEAKKKSEEENNPEDNKYKDWIKWCVDINQKYPATRPQFFSVSKPMNPYAFTTRFFDVLEENDIVVCGNGSACVVTFQAADIKKGQRLFTNSGCAAMGYGFPASIGAAVAKKGERIICVDGDGSFQMNLQELQTVVYNRLNLKIFYLNNNGYHSIRQTQTNLFNPPMVGVSDGNGLSFPDAKKIAYAYDIPYILIDDLNDVRDKMQEAFLKDGPVFIEVEVDDKQFFEPKLSSKVLPDGRIVSPELDDMYPFLDREEYEACRFKN